MNLDSNRFVSRILKTWISCHLIKQWLNRFITVS